MLMEVTGDTVTITGLDKTIEEQFASEAKLERIKVPNIRSSSAQIRRALKSYFSTPKLLQQGSVFSLLVHCGIGNSNFVPEDSDEEEVLFNANPSASSPILFTSMSCTNEIYS